MAYVLGNGVIEGATRVVRETATGREQLGGDGAPIVISNTGQATAAHRYGGASWAPLSNPPSGTFLLLNPEDSFGSVATLRPDAGVRIMTSRVRNTGAGFEFFFDLTEWNGTFWNPLAPTLNVQNGGSRAAGAVSTDGRVNVGWAGNIGGNQGLEVGLYVP